MVADSVALRSLPTFIPLSEAARKYDLPEGVFTRLVLDGRIDAARLPSGDIEVSDDGRISQIETREQVIHKKFAHLRGRTICIAEAARQYGISHSTVVRWTEMGYIAKVGMDRNRVLLDLADVAYCAEVYRLQGGGQGKRIFDRAGYPYRRVSAGCWDGRN